MTSKNVLTPERNSNRPPAHNHTHSHAIYVYEYEFYNRITTEYISSAECRTENPRHKLD